MDTDLPMSFMTLGNDVAALLDHSAIANADLVGFSFGGASPMRAAIQHPDRVRRFVVISTRIRGPLGIRKRGRA